MPEEKPEDHIRPGKISADSVDASEEIERIGQKYPNGAPWAKDASAYPGEPNNPGGRNAADQSAQDHGTTEQATQQPPDESGTTSME
jgi:hypothetical protein